MANFELEKDLTSAERPILQKLFSLEGPGRRRKGIQPKEQEALDQGWGESGPVGKVARLKSITRDPEEQVASRM
jgi:hypothetical protein